MNRLLDKQYGTNKLPNGESDTVIANNLKTFFHERVANIYESIKSKLKECSTTPNVPSSSNKDTAFCNKSATNFKLMTEGDVADVIKEMSNKSCVSDPIPTWIFKNCLHELLPTVTLIVNASLQSGVFPEQLKSAVVRATLKKSNLDSDDLKNYRPISNLSYILIQDY